MAPRAVERMESNLMYNQILILKKLFNDVQKNGHADIAFKPARKSYPPNTILMELLAILDVK
jgi:hypothetical protein